MTTNATMRDLRNHTRAVIERAQVEAVTITDGGVPIAILTAITPNEGVWDADTWLETVTGSDWKPYDSGLAAHVNAARATDESEPDAVERLDLA